MGSPTDDEQLRAQAVQQADELIAACVALRADLRAYESVVRKVRTQTARGPAQNAVGGVADFVDVRTRLSDGIAMLEQCRRRWRSSLFHYQADGGMSLAAIARDWGFSRQLVSRLFNDEFASDSPS